MKTDKAIGSATEGCLPRLVGAKRHQCGKCGRWLGSDGYPRAVWDDWNGGWEADPICGPCGREMGYKDLRCPNRGLGQTESGLTSVNADKSQTEHDNSTDEAI